MFKKKKKKVNGRGNILGVTNVVPASADMLLGGSDVTKAVFGLRALSTSSCSAEQNGILFYFF